MMAISRQGSPKTSFQRCNGVAETWGNCPQWNNSRTIVTSWSYY